MYDFDFTSLATTIASFFNLVSGILKFDEQAYRAVYAQEGGYLLALLILVLGGISLELGQSAVLFANRVRRRRFLISLFLGGLVWTLGILFWAGAVWGLARLFFGSSLLFVNIFIGAAISTAPLLFGFSVLLPYLGMFLFQVLRIYVLLIYLNIINLVTDIGIWWAFAISLAGWLLLELVLRIPALRYDRVRSWYWRATTGTPYRQEIDEVVQKFLTDLRSAVGLESDKSKESQE
jgi:hypothetical protein